MVGNILYEKKYISKDTAKCFSVFVPRCRPGTTASLVWFLLLHSVVLFFSALLWDLQFE